MKLRLFGNAVTRKLLLALVAGLGAGLAIGTTMVVRGVASPAASPPAAVHECFNNTSKVVTYSSTGMCPGGTTALAAIAQQSGVAYLYTQVGALQTLLKGVTRTTVNGYATLRFSGLNLQVVNGSGSESTLNGLGNLIVGYANDAGFARTGSHNLITGNFGGWASYGGLLAGSNNQVTGGYDSVSGGSSNVASGSSASISGGGSNVASGSGASVSGGGSNTAAGTWDAILGGSSESIASGISCGYFPDSAATSHC